MLILGKQMWGNDNRQRRWCSVGSLVNRMKPRPHLFKLITQMGEMLSGIGQRLLQLMGKTVSTQGFKQLSGLTTACQIFIKPLLPFLR
jgi:hypothetical protein